MTATGSSEADSIVPSPGPICGIPIENKSGGRTTPNIPRINPYGVNVFKVDKFNKNVGGNNAKTTIKAPMEKRALFNTGEVSFSTELLRKIEVVYVKAASSPHIVPFKEITLLCCVIMFAAKTEPTIRMNIEISFSFVGFFLLNIQSKSVPIQTN